MLESPLDELKLFLWNVAINVVIDRLHGSYEAIEGGQAMDALVDLTGGIPRLYEIQDKDPFLYRMIEKAQQKGAFITCSRKVRCVEVHT